MNTTTTVAKLTWTDKNTVVSRAEALAILGWTEDDADWMLSTALDCCATAAYCRANIEEYVALQSLLAHRRAGNEGRKWSESNGRAKGFWS